MKTYPIKSMLFIIASYVMLSGCTTPLRAPTLETKSSPFPDYATQSAGTAFDPDKITALAARMEKFVTDGDTAGIATLLVQDGKVINHTQAGIRRVADRAPITQDTIYRIYSMTKPITGVALMTLYEDGKFSLDDPVSKFIPEFSDLKVVKTYDKEGGYELESLTRQPTMRELMSHTAGFAYGLYGDDPANMAFKDQKILRSPDLQTFITKVADVPLMHQPGKQWFYSAAVDIQGAIIERLSGMALGDYFQTHLFEPLDMDDTGFYVPIENYDRFSEVFGYDPETKQFGPAPYKYFPTLIYKKETVAMESGGGGLVSTLDDYARFCQMLANGGTLGGKRILKTETVELMRTDVLKGSQKVTIDGVLTPATSKALGFGLDFGIIHNKDGSDVLQGDGTYYWGGAAGTWFWIDPVNNLYFIGMIQRFGTNGPAIDFRGISRDMVYDALK